MAGDWIKLLHVTPDKPEIYKIAAELNISPEEAFGRCCRIWIWADQQSLNGHALSVTFVTLDCVARRDGFAKSMLSAGWLVTNEDGTMSFPNFERHNGKTSKKRALSAERQSKKRRKNAKKNVTLSSRFRHAESVTREDYTKNSKLSYDKNSKPPFSFSTDVEKESSPQKKKTFFKDWLLGIKSSGCKPVSDYAPVWAYARKVGLDPDWIQIAWAKFCDRYLHDPNYSSKRYIDWRRVFLNAVEGNWFGLWRSSENGFILTTVGKQADIMTRDDDASE